jgi:hypothetical protein
MNDEKFPKIWSDILELLSEKLQLGLLEQAKCVTEARIENHELWIKTDNEDAFKFFSSEVNQQRLIILARPVIAIEKIVPEKN